ncbi:MAG: hypothetical protein ACLPX5_07795 [Dissulfurispiraceae bacterium]
MEYLLVRFVDTRHVKVDNVLQGLTNEVIELEEGTHYISLSSPPSDFKPLEVKKTLSGTSSLSPMEVIFEKI